MSLAEILGYVVERLDRAGIPHMISGSVASAHHGEPRSTQDVDLVIDPTVIALTTFVGSLDRERYYIDDALEALERRSQCNVIDVTTGWKVDLIVVKDRPFSRVELARRQPLTLLGIGTFVATVEDVILSKLEWSRASESERQVRDVVAMLRLRAGELDDAYLDRWARALDLVSVLDDARRSAANP